MSKYEMIAFDIDGTLTESKHPLDEGMAELIVRLLDRYKVAIISGAGYPQFEKQIVERLSAGERELENLYLLPADGTMLCTYSGGWQCEEDEPLSEEEFAHVSEILEAAWKEAGLPEPERIYGEQIEHRGAQVSFSALGQGAPLEEKKAWDLDHKKRLRMLEVLKKTLSGYSAHIGGTTTIDVNRAGIDKAYGLGKVLEKTGLSPNEMLYVGDELFEGGNDAPARKTGAECREVSGLNETKELIRGLLQ